MIKLPDIHLNFPRYPRFLSAKPFQTSRRVIGKLILWIGISVLGITNITLGTKQLPLPRTLYAPANNLMVTVYNWKNSARGVLGISTDQAQDESTARNKRATLENQFTYWQTIVSEHTQYRDGYLMLAALAYQLDKPNQMRFYIDRAKQIDPNNPTPKLFEGLVIHSQ